MTITVTVRGVCTTASLTHQRSPDGGSPGQPAPQIKTNVMTRAGLQKLPYITANSARGLIRRACAEFLYDVLAAKKSRIHRNLYLSISRGSYARTGLNTGGATYAQLIAAQHHIFAGLFGGGANMLSSALHMEGDLVPVLMSNAHLLPASVRAHAIDIDDPRKLLTIDLMAPRDDFSGLPAPARKVVDNLEESHREYMQNKLDQKGQDVTKDDLANFATVEAIIPGVPLSFGATARNITPAQGGLLLMGLLSWANRNALGGASARGRGAFIPDFTVTIDGKDCGPLFTDGSAPDLSLTDRPEIKALLDACLQEISGAATPEALINVYPIDVESKAGKEKKGKGPAKKKASAEAPTAAGA